MESGRGARRKAQQTNDPRFDSFAAGLEAQIYKVTNAFMVVSKAVTELGAGAEASRDFILKLSTHQGASDSALLGMQSLMESVLAVEHSRPACSAGNGSQRISQAVDDPLQALASTVNDQGLAMR